MVSHVKCQTWVHTSLAAFADSKLKTLFYSVHPLRIGEVGFFFQGSHAFAFDSDVCGSPAYVCFLLRQRLWVQLYQRWEGLLQLFNEAARASVVITPVREIAARPAPLPSSLRLRIPRRRFPEHPPQPAAVLVSAQFVLACRCMPSQLALTLDMWPTRPRQLWKVTRNSECNVRK